MGALLVLVLLALVTGCSDAPTEKEIFMADDGVNPSIVSVFVTEQLDTVVEQLGTAFLTEHPGITFQYTHNTSDVLADRVRQGFRPTLWIDDSTTLAPFLADPKVQGAPVTFGDDEMQFVVLKNYPGPLPTLEVFGAGTKEPISGLCDPSAACGPPADAILAAAGVTPAPDVVKATGFDIVTALNDGSVQTTLIYRTDTARLYTKFRFIPLEDPTIGKIIYQSIRFTNVPVASDFQTWVQTAPEAEAILKKYGYIPRSGPRTP